MGLDGRFKLYFYPRSPCGERLPYQRQINQKRNFYPRSPCGERPNANLRRHRGNDDFYPRSPCGERHSQSQKHETTAGFLSTLSLRRATRAPPYNLMIHQISIHALLAESDCRPGRNIRDALPISIHALLAESDRIFLDLTLQERNFYPRSPCGERHFRRSIKRAICNFYPRSPCGERRECWTDPNHLFRFLSTLSLRRATIPGGGHISKANFYPRSPCGERQM